MAEVVGVIASGAAIVSLAREIFESVYKLQRLLTAIQDAPHELKTILEEIAIVTDILVQCSESPHTLPTDPKQHVARDPALLHCETACKHLHAIISEIEEGTRGSKWRSRWSSVVAVLKEKKIANLMARLERAKSTLALAQVLRLQTLEQEKRGPKEGPCLTPTVQTPQLVSSSIGIRQNGNKDVHKPYSETHFHLGIGVLVVRQSKTTRAVPLSSLEGTTETMVQFRFSDWFLRWGFKIAVGREFGAFKTTIIPQRLVPEDSAIFQACALGDDEAVARLIREGKASPFDTTSSGVTPLLVAAAWLHPSISKQLLEYGADDSASIQYYDFSFNPLVMAVERAGHFRYFLFPGLEDYRLEPERCLVRMRETMRVLTEHGSVDVHQYYNPDEDGYSALHHFRGSSEDFSWLIKRDDTFMTARDWDHHLASIVLQQTQMFPNDSFPAAFSKVSDMKFLAGYKDSSGSSLLHYLLDTNFGTKPGFWHNGLDIFTFVRPLLEHGADPGARNDRGYTPLMNFARTIRRHWCMLLLPDIQVVTEVCSEFFARWVEVLKSCDIDLHHYRSREVESGAERFASCLDIHQFQEPSYAFSGAKHWFVRLVFEQVDPHQELQIKLELKSKDKDKIMPGTWPGEFLDTI
ncbi:hypothetical protein PV08_08383 [Exophiala spinifera]|uniref:NACHT-NTPase and P-loop NTPases N-terminal domain-containing protein n=1 Tax=Exophiala spinifera TaxID=91928 RepID=A0A0D1YDR9_9EURO|nr:uncharacterized protein PV08_08383 [Exophiala spinifera]KIW13196.1 hypothetical protein PV08_08383 [Exophiala spinifera]